MQEISRTKRYFPPAHYSLKVEKYSQLSEVEEYKTGVFEAGGYKWRLIFYPNGDEENNGMNHVSLYLEIVETDDFPVDWEVNIKFKFFVHDQLEDKYLTIQDHANGSVRRFNEMKKIWGFSQLLSLASLNDPSNRYIVNDSCLFGAEVFVINYDTTKNWESLSLVKAPDIKNATFTWQIDNFDSESLDKDSYSSKDFSVGGRKWNLTIHPKGEVGYQGKSLSLFLNPSNWQSHPTKSGVHARYKFRVVDQVNDNHFESKVMCHCFSAPESDWGFRYFIELEDLRRPSRGFIVNNSLKVEVEFLAVSQTEHFSKSAK